MDIIHCIGYWISKSVTSVMTDMSEMRKVADIYVLLFQGDANVVDYAAVIRVLAAFYQDINITPSTESSYNFFTKWHLMQQLIWYRYSTHIGYHDHNALLSLTDVNKYQYIPTLQNTSLMYCYLFPKSLLLCTLNLFHKIIWKFNEQCMWAEMSHFSFPFPTKKAEQNYLGAFKSMNCFFFFF